MPTFLDFYGFRSQPFGITPDPAYLYASRTHSEALANLSSGVADNRGFLALIAQPGMGKTTLLYRLLEDLRDTTRTVLVSQTTCTSREFIEYILQELGVDIEGMGLVSMHGTLNEILFEELLAGKRFVLVVDEAQNLDNDVLETVRMLSNFETHNAKLLQIVLAGQPRLAMKLTQPGLSQLRQRIAVLSHLEPFTAEETRLYIEHRLKVAGYSGDPIFDSAAIGLIARQSDGIPRIINNICYRSLQLSAARGQHAVTAEIAREAADCLDLERLVSPPVKVASSLPPPVVLPAPAAAPQSRAAAAGASIHADRHAPALLSYDAGKPVTPPKWRARSAILGVILLTGTLLLAMLGRSESQRGFAEDPSHKSAEAAGSPAPAVPSQDAGASYDAAPLDTGNGQVLTVMAGPQQTLKDLSLRYAGHYDSDLAQQIRNLNPDLKDPDHLEAGDLIRIPLPPGAMKKVNDTEETDASTRPAPSGSLLARLTALLRDRK